MQTLKNINPNLIITNNNAIKMMVRITIMIIVKKNKNDYS